ncbi:MAG: putative DNA primase/helicase [Gammaproteobacteria bacterium]|jgi:putative DNA primase/helicase
MRQNNDTPLSETLIDPEISIEPQYELTELGNGNRYASLFGSTYKFIKEKKNWFKWNGHCWEENNDGAAVRNMDLLLIDIKTEGDILNKRAMKLLDLAAKTYNEKYEILAESSSKLSKEIFKWYRSSQSNQRIKSTLDLARSRPNLSMSITTFDSKGHYLGVENGVINLRTGEFIKGDSKYFITKSTGETYDYQASCPKWNEFLLMIFENNVELIQFIQRLIGQAVLGVQGKDKLAIFFGSGANGKNSLLDTLKYVFGDYASVTDPRIILEGGSNKEYYLAKLIGIRLLLMSETKKGSVIAEEIVKMVVDSGQISARFIYGNVFDYQPVFTPILSTNHKPHIGTH